MANARFQTGVCPLDFVINHFTEMLSNSYESVYSDLSIKGASTDYAKEIENEAETRGSGFGCLEK